MPDLVTRDDATDQHHCQRQRTLSVGMQGLLDGRPMHTLCTKCNKNCTYTHPRCVGDSAPAAHVFVHVSAVHKEEPRKEGKTRTHVVGLKKRKAFHRPPPTAYCAMLCCILAHRTKLSLAFSLTRFPLSFPEIDRERLCTAAGAINRLTFCWWWQLSHTHPHTVLRTHTRSRLNFVCQRRRM